MDIENENAAEIQRLRGELLVTCKLLALALTASFHRDAIALATLRGKIDGFVLEGGAVNDLRIEGIDNFKKRLLQHLPSNEV